MLDLDDYEKKSLLKGDKSVEPSRVDEPQLLKPDQDLEASDPLSVLELPVKLTTLSHGYTSYFLDYNHVYFTYLMNCVCDLITLVQHRLTGSFMDDVEVEPIPSVNHLDSILLQGNPNISIKIILSFILIHIMIL